ncbi:MAG: SDR family NAD(P)-dependent oxidoreductase [Verrucomicrobiales bacterium]
MGIFDEKVAVVTGAGRGIGLAIAQELAAGGARVAVVSRTEANSTKAADELNASFPGFRPPLCARCPDTAACMATGKQIISDFGKVDILVNNAGVTRDGLCMRMSDEDLGYRSGHQSQGCLQHDQSGAEIASKTGRCPGH